MAEFNSTTFGTISGRHGSAVATTMKNGKSILKVFRAPSNPKSEKQVAQRTKFAFAISSLSCMRDLFNITFRANGGANYGIGLAMKNAVVGVTPDFSIDFSKLTLTVGSLYGSGVNTVAKTAGTTVKATWLNSIRGAGRADDTVSLVFFNDEWKEVLLQENSAIRLDGTVESELPTEWAGCNIHCWIYFSRVDGKLNSTSQFIDTVLI